MPHDVFISYSSNDKAIADAVCGTLEGKRIRCWIAPRDLLPGLSYGEAILISRLGQGGMGVVYRTWQPSLGRQVALKCMLRAGDPKAEARFLREIRALGRIEHPNVVKVFTSGAEGEQWFYAMELIEGAELSRVLEHSPPAVGTTRCGSGTPKPGRPSAPSKATPESFGK